MAGKKYMDMKESDFVEFFLFPNLESFLPKGRDILKVINELKESICEIVKKVSQNYIWHNESFQISPKNLVSLECSDSDNFEAFCYYGCLNYGENIEDEWFLVYILLELTKEITDLVVRVKDTDGEFLLIEAAEQLPSWVTPETCEDRVFIYNGCLHILPQYFLSNNDEYHITEDVINFVRNNSEKTKVGLQVQNVIKKKISGYPEKIEENYHKVNLYVPVAVAALLNSDPSLIAPAVRAFCDRDLLDIKACQAMKFFPPENRVLTQVKFTKCLYAMLATSKYVPDQRTGWSLPHPNDVAYKSHLLGVKVACGFEILLSHVRGRLRDEESDDTNFDHNLNWKKFLRSLSSKNYFRGLLEHSKEFNELLEAAKDFYKKSLEEAIKPNKAKEICDLMDRLEIDVEELRRNEKNLPKSDDDDWMNITQEDLDAMLEARFGRSRQMEEDLIDGNPDIVDHLKTFINHISGVEGAELPKMNEKGALCGKLQRGVKAKKTKTVKFSPDTKLHSSTSDEKISSGKSSKIQFDPDGFINAIQNILDFSIPDDNYWESEGSGMSSYEDETDIELGESIKPATSKKDKEILKYMRRMDEELANTTMAESFVTKDSVNGENVDETFDDIETFKPVDIDRNAFRNILSSYQAQMGNPGPAENLLGPLGVNLNDIDADVD